MKYQRKIENTETDQKFLKVFLDFKHIEVYVVLLICTYPESAENALQGYISKSVRSFDFWGGFVIFLKLKIWS